MRKGQRSDVLSHIDNRSVVDDNEDVGARLRDSCKRFDLCRPERRIADLITQAWSSDPNDKKGLYYRLTLQQKEDDRIQAAKDELDYRGIHLIEPVVISEKEYYEEWELSIEALPNSAAIPVRALNIASQIACRLQRLKRL
jgi:hypothetical protein